MNECLAKQNGRLVSVCIPTLERADALVTTVADLLEQDYLNFEIIVVDQSENENEAVLAMASASPVRLAYSRVSYRSLPIARNDCVRRAAGEIVVFIDDDVRLARDFLSAHARNYDDPSVMGVAGAVLEDGRTQLLDVPPSRGYVYGRDYLCLYSSRRGEVRGTKGCNMSFRRSVFHQLGGFEEALPPPFLREDTDLTVRMNKAKMRIMYDPMAALEHLKVPAGGTARLKLGRGSERKPWLNPACYECETVFQIKHFGTISIPGFLMVFFLGWCIGKSRGNPRTAARAVAALGAGCLRGIRRFRELKNCGVGQGARNCP